MKILKNLSLLLMAFFLIVSCENEDDDKNDNKEVIVDFADLHVEKFSFEGVDFVDDILSVGTSYKMNVELSTLNNVANYSSKFQVYFSDDNQISDDDWLLYEEEFSASQGTSTLDFTGKDITLNTNICTSNQAKYILITVDPENAVEEDNETNNVFVQDISITGNDDCKFDIELLENTVTIPDGVLAPNQEFTVNLGYNVNNIPYTNGNTSFTIETYMDEVLFDPLDPEKEEVLSNRVADPVTITVDESAKFNAAVRVVDLAGTKAIQVKVNENLCFKTPNQRLRFVVVSTSESDDVRDNSEIDFDVVLDNTNIDNSACNFNVKIDKVYLDDGDGNQDDVPETQLGGTIKLNADLIFESNINEQEVTVNLFLINPADGNTKPHVLTEKVLVPALTSTKKVELDLDISNAGICNTTGKPLTDRKIRYEIVVEDLLSGKEFDFTDKGGKPAVDELPITLTGTGSCQIDASVQSVKLLKADASGDLVNVAHNGEFTVETTLNLDQNDEARTFTVTYYLVDANTPSFREEITSIASKTYTVTPTYKFRDKIKLKGDVCILPGADYRIEAEVSEIATEINTANNTGNTSIAITGTKAGCSLNLSLTDVVVKEVQGGSTINETTGIITSGAEYQLDAKVNISDIPANSGTPATIDVNLYFVDNNPNDGIFVPEIKFDDLTFANQADLTLAKNGTVAIATKFTVPDNICNGGQYRLEFRIEELDEEKNAINFNGNDNKVQYASQMTDGHGCNYSFSIDEDNTKVTIASVDYVIASGLPYGGKDVTLSTNVDYADLRENTTLDIKASLVRFRVVSGVEGQEDTRQEVSSVLLFENETIDLTKTAIGANATTIAHTTANFNFPSNFCFIDEDNFEIKFELTSTVDGKQFTQEQTIDFDFTTKKPGCITDIEIDENSLVLGTKDDVLKVDMNKRNKLEFDILSKDIPSTSDGKDLSVSVSAVLKNTNDSTFEEEITLTTSTVVIPATVAGEPAASNIKYSTEFDFPKNFCIQNQSYFVEITLDSGNILSGDTNKSNNTREFAIAELLGNGDECVGDVILGDLTFKDKDDNETVSLDVDDENTILSTLTVKNLGANVLIRIKGYLQDNNDANFEEALFTTDYKSLTSQGGNDVFGDFDENGELQINEKIQFTNICNLPTITSRKVVLKVETIESTRLGTVLLEDIPNLDFDNNVTMKDIPFFTGIGQGCVNLNGDTFQLTRNSRGVDYSYTLSFSVEESNNIKSNVYEYIVEEVDNSTTLLTVKGNYSYDGSTVTLVPNNGGAIETVDYPSGDSKIRYKSLDLVKQ